LLSGDTISGTPTVAGTFNFTVKVVDGIGAATKNLSITVHTGIDITTTSLPDGEVGLAYSQKLTASGGTGSYTWSIGSGDLPSGLSLSGDTISGTPTAAGTSSFTVRVSDGISTATKPLSITINHEPVAQDDYYSTNKNTALNIGAPGVLGNDTDVDGDTLTIGIPRPVSEPSHGTLTLNADGSFTYTPDANYNGPDSFTYRAYDGSLYSNVANVYITVNITPRPPSGGGGGGGGGGGASIIVPTPKITTMPTPSLTPAPEVTPTPEMTPTPEITPTPEVTVTPIETATPTPTPTPTPAPGVPGVPWSMIGGIIGGVIAAGLLFYFLLRRRGEAAG
jgi:hypothetical protein